MAVQGEEHRDSVSSPCVSRSSAPRRPTPTVSTCKNTRRYNRCNRHPAAAVVARTIRIFHLRTPGAHGRRPELRLLDPDPSLHRRDLTLNLIS